MIIPKQEEQELLQSDFDSTGFEIDKSDLAIVFSTISEGLYSDPLSSIVREITSNAIDATVEAGKDDPVIVKLDQDTGGAYLSIQDFGIGLSLERIESVYKKLFKSTKRDRNDQIGAFGLGRFSIFSYTNTFYLTTVFDGIEYGYQLYLQDGIPSMLDLYSKPTTAPNGTTVKIYLQSKDIEKAREKIKSTLMYFSNVYVIDNILGGKKYNNEYRLVEGKTFIHSTNSEHEDLHICLGGVYYPINWSMFNYKHRIQMNCALKFNNGDLAVTRSREEIKYTDETTAKIKSAIDSFIAEVDELYHKEDLNVKDFKTFDELSKIGSVHTTINVGEVNIEIDSTALNLSFRRYYYNDGSLNLSTKYELNAILAAIGGSVYFINRTTLSAHETELGYRTDLNKVCYKFSNESLTRKILNAANAQGYSKIVIFSKKFKKKRNDINTIGALYSGDEPLNSAQAARVVIQRFIAIIFKLKSLYTIKHISEFKEEKVNVVKNLTFRISTNNSQHRLVPKIDLTKHKGVILHNIALKKEEFLAQIFSHSIITKGTKKDLVASGLPYKTMEEVVKMSKMHDLLRAYKLSKTYSGVTSKYLQAGLVKNLVLEELLKANGKVDGLKIPHSDLLDEMLATYEEEHPIDVTAHSELLKNYSTFSRIAEHLLQSSLTLKDKFIAIRALSISSGLQHVHWLNNTKFIESLEYLVDRFSMLNYSDKNTLGDVEPDLYAVLDDFKYANNVSRASFHIPDDVVLRVIALAETRTGNPLKALVATPQEIAAQNPPF